MRIKKKPALILLMIVSMLCLIFGAVACGGTSAKDAIEKYILPQNETLVDADFTLPKTIGTGIEVKWQSSNTDVIAIEDSGDKYTAKVTLPTEVTTVTLTISSGEHSKNFTVRVDEFSVFTFIKNYKFAQKNTAVKEDFKLETKATYQGKEATIEWSIDEKYNAWINLNDAKDTVLVTPAEEVKPVEIAAKFTYAGESATQKYPFSVAPPLAHLQIVNRMYSVSEYPVDLSGYIVHLTEASEQFGNATFFMIDEDFCCGYYVYRVAIDKSDVAKFEEGAYVTVTGAKATEYNGLWETTQSTGTATIDTSKEKIDPREHVYAYDTDLLSGVPSAIWHQSQLVSLSGWKVESKASSKPTAAASDLFTIKRGDVSMLVYISKYITRTDAELSALCNVYDDVKVGDFVNITGLLGNFNGAQIQPIVAGDITKADKEGTNENAPKIKDAVKAVDDAVKANFSGLITSAKEVTMPTSESGVTISYEVVGAQNPTVVITDGKFNINPIDEMKNYDVKVTYTIGDYTGYSFFALRNQKANPEVIVGEVVKQLQEQTIGAFNGPGQISLPAVKDDMGTTIEWSVEDGNTLTWVKVEKGKLTIAPMPASTTTVTLVATVSLGEEKDTVEYTITVRVGDFNLLNTVPAEGGEFVLSAMHYGKRVYATGTLDKDTGAGFLNTTENISDAAKMKIEKKDSNWLIKVGTKYLEVNPYANSSGNASYNVRLVDTATNGAVWEWDDTIKIFKQKPVATEEGVTPANDYFYIGMRDNATFTTMSPSNVSYITGKNEANLDVVQHPARFGANPFTALETPTAGDYAFSAMKKGERLYASSLELDGNYIATSKDAAQAVKFTIEKKDSNWLIKMGAKYLEINPYQNKDKVSYSLRLVDTATAGAVWEWDETIKIFKQKPVATEEGVTPDDAYFYIGTYDSSKYDTLSPSNISYITGDNAKNLDISQHPGRFGTVEVVEGTTPGGGTTQPEPEEPTLPEGGTQDDPYTIAEALTVAKALDKGAYTATKVYITGYVVDAGSWSDDYGNWSSIYLADSAAAKKADGIQLYRLNPDDIYLKLANDLAVGATITVYGYLQNYNGTLEITNNTTVDKQDKVTVISYTDPRTVDQKIKAAINAVTLIAKVAGDIDLPKSTVTGVTLAFTSDNTAITVGTDKLTVTRGTADVSVKITVSANAEGGTAQTKDLTVIVRNSSVSLASLSFAKKSDGRESQTDDAQVWKKNGITFTNEKSSSTNKVGDYENPVRVYAKSTVKVEYTSAVQEIVFHCNSTSYASDLQKSLNGVEGVTVTVSGSDVYVVFATAQTSLEFTASAQLRFNSIEVVYSTPAATANA